MTNSRSRFSNFLKILSHFFLQNSANTSILPWFIHHPEVLLSIFGSRFKRDRGCFVHVQELKLPWQVKIEQASCTFKHPFHHHSLQEVYWIRIEALPSIEARESSCCSSRGHFFDLFNSQNCCDILVVHCMLSNLSFEWAKMMHCTQRSMWFKFGCCFLFSSIHAFDDVFPWNDYWSLMYEPWQIEWYAFG
jgi:hypothetical protein